MAIKARFKKDDIRKAFDKAYEKVEKAVINRLIYVGEEFVKNARNNGDYNDITGNLRSSIGYAIFKNGQILNQNVIAKSRGAAGTEGVTKAKSLIDELLADYPTGLGIIVVAGMDYAAAVESKGREVLTASSITAKNELKRGLEKLKVNLTER